MVHNVTPEERYSGKKPDLSHLKVFGCICYVHVPDELRTKLDANVEKCIFLGYSLEHKVYRCYEHRWMLLFCDCRHYDHKWMLLFWVYFMKAESKVFGYFQEFKAMVEKEIGLQIKCLQSDNGGEYT